MKTEREKIYDQLLIDFAEFVRCRGGWDSEFGTELDGILWKLSERFGRFMVVYDLAVYKLIRLAAKQELLTQSSLLPDEKEV